MSPISIYKSVELNEDDNRFTLPGDIYAELQREHLRGKCAFWNFYKDQRLPILADKPLESNEFEFLSTSVYYGYEPEGQGGRSIRPPSKIDEKISKEVPQEKINITVDSSKGKKFEKAGFDDCKYSFLLIDESWLDNSTTGVYVLTPLLLDNTLDISEHLAKYFPFDRMRDEVTNTVFGPAAEKYDEELDYAEKTELIQHLYANGFQIKTDLTESDLPKPE